MERREVIIFLFNVKGSRDIFRVRGYIVFRIVVEGFFVRGSEIM